MAPTTLLSLLALLLGQASARTVVVYGLNYEPCELDDLQLNFFHAVTCFGFARVPLKNLNFESFNAKVDAVLEKAAADRERQGQEVNCRTYEVMPFYYSPTQLLFLRVPKVFAGDQLREEERDVAYWIADVGGRKNEFVLFPDHKNWTVIGKGYWDDKYNLLTADKKVNAICDPKYVNYEMRKEHLYFSALTQYVELTSGHHKITRKDRQCKIVTKAYSVCDNHGQCRNYGQFFRSDAVHDINNNVLKLDGDRNSEFMTQMFDRNVFSARRERVDSRQYYYTFRRMTLEDLERRLSGKPVEVKNYCYLRKFRHDLGELNVPYMLPQDKNTKLIAEPPPPPPSTPSSTPATTTTATTSTTATSTTTTSTSTTSTSTTTTTTATTSTSTTTSIPTTKRRVETVKVLETTTSEAYKPRYQEGKDVNEDADDPPVPELTFREYTETSTRSDSPSVSIYMFLMLIITAVLL